MSQKTSIDYSEKIPNNVSLSADRKLQRALESWQPKFLQWWSEMGPEGFQACDFFIGSCR
jgi:benzoyl-CoA 2,3-dioxygenase component B